MALEPAARLADKLLREGERTLTVFQQLPAEAWTLRIYDDGAQWTTRDVFEHLILSEQAMVPLCAQILATGIGAPEAFNIDDFNQRETGRLASLSQAALFERYAVTRQQTAQYAHGLTRETLARRGRHPAMGDAAIEDILKLIYLHHAMHTRDVMRRLASRQTS